MSRLVLPALVLLALVVALLVWTHRSTPGRVLRADPARTPGALNPAVTPATLRDTVCIRGWSATVRPDSGYTSALKLRQMTEYRVGGDPRGYEEDHFIPLSLGGHPTDPRNLWPEPQPRASAVDRLELQLHDDVCAGRVALEAAQRRIAEEKWARG